MRAFSARRIATSALCATFLFGVTAPAALAADTARDRGSKSAAPSEAELQSQVRQLAAIGTVVPPVTALMNAVLEDDDSQLSDAEATTLGNAAKAAIARAAATPVTSTTPVTSATPMTPANPATSGVTTSVVPFLPFVPFAPAAPIAPATSVNPASVSLQTENAGSGDARAAADLTALLTELQTAVDALVTAAKSGDPAAALLAVTGVAQKLANVVLGILGSVGLPSNPSVPSVPNSPVLPQE
ncbi:cytochrome c [Streptomyces ipomoeae]|uniref:cytochrome c n=1 Tax=Streptomyces ipomoeae TaxID=103232 RepID=UPI001147827E|nr:cytochrome c [Streptomyces ipomoeae]TQE37385.1 hypothetical protein Sipo7851_09310 [Streptomyces ipomoeae]